MGRAPAWLRIRRWHDVEPVKPRRMTGAGVKARKMTHRLIEDQVADDVGVITLWPAVGLKQRVMLLVGQGVLGAAVGAGAGVRAIDELAVVTVVGADSGADAGATMSELVSDAAAVVEVVGGARRAAR